MRLVCPSFHSHFNFWRFMSFRLAMIVFLEPLAPELSMMFVLTPPGNTTQDIISEMIVNKDKYGLLILDPISTNQGEQDATFKIVN
jgi:hypothetical protein